MNIKPCTDPNAHDGVYWHSSVQEFGDFAEPICVNYHAHGADWSGDTHENVMRLLRNGDTKAVPEAEALLSQINADVDLRGLAPSWEPAPVGAHPNVPAFLSGSPESMWCKMHSRAPLGAVKVVFCVTSSGGITAQQLRKRGVTVLAAVMALSRVRPVEVWVVTALDVRHQQAVRLSQPIMLSEAAFALISTAFDRRLFHGVCKQDGYRGGWSRWFVSPERDCLGPAKTEIAARKVFGLADDDIFIPPIFVTEQDSVTSRGVAWINGLLDKYRE